MGFFAMRSAKSHTVCDILAVGVLGKFPIVLMIQCKTSTTETIPDLKQLLKLTEYDFQEKSNLQKLEELVEADNNFHKLVIWKGKGRLNMYAYRFTGENKWRGTKIKSLEDYIFQII